MLAFDVLIAGQQEIKSRGCVIHIQHGLIQRYPDVVSNLIVLGKGAGCFGVWERICRTKVVAYVSHVIVRAFLVVNGSYNCIPEDLWVCQIRGARVSGIVEASKCILSGVQEIIGDFFVMVVSIF